MFKPAIPTPTDPQLEWTYTPVRGGESVRGWIAGNPVAIESHHEDYTKPCRAWISDGKLPCWRGRTCVTRLVSYVPLYTCPELEKIVVLVSKSVALKIPKCVTHVPVKISRPTTKNNPPLRLNWEAGADFPERQTKQIRNRLPADIRPYLLHLWQDEEICKHCGVDFVPSRATDEARAKQELKDQPLQRFAI